MSIKAVESPQSQIVEISAREFRAAVLFCVVVATLNALVFVYRIAYIVGNTACRCYPPLARDNSYDFMRLKIELALVVIAIALRSRRVVGFCLSVVGTLFIEFQYGLWYLDTQRWLREMHVSNFSQLPKPSEWQHFAGIYQGMPWDLALLVFGTALFAWQVRVLIALITSARRRKQSA